MQRTLGDMASNTKPDKFRAKISELLSTPSSGLDPQADAETERELEKVIDEILNSDQNSAQQNVTRLKTVSSFFKSESNIRAGIAIQRLMEPLDYGINKLLHRTELRFHIKHTLDPEKKKTLEDENLDL